MKKSLKNLAIMLLVCIDMALWKVRSLVATLGSVIIRPSIDFQEVTRVTFGRNWAKRMERGRNIFKKEVVPILKPPLQFNNRPP